MKLLIVFCFFLGLAKGNYKDFRRLDQIKLEQECSRAGGMCVPEQECPPGHLTEKRGLCPRQQTMNVECCYGLSIKETRCSKRGGVCVKNNTCMPTLQFKDAIDCREEEICCILT